jgi:hypothetical protein
MPQKTLHQQTGKFIASISEHLPELTVQEMQTLIQNPQELEKRLYESLVPKSRQSAVPLTLISKRHPLIIDECSGNEIFKNASDVFDDRNMANIFELFDCSNSREAVLVEVYGVNKTHHITFQRIFNALSADLNMLCLTEHQIIKFCKKYKSWLSDEDGITNFLFKKNNDYLLAYVYRGSMDQLDLNITHLNYDDNMPLPRKGCRVVVPQLIF